MKNVIYGVFALVFAAFVTPAMVGEASGQFTVISGKEKYTTAGGVTIKKQGGNPMMRAVTWYRGVCHAGNTDRGSRDVGA